MDFNKILKEINNLPKHVKDLVIKGMLITSIGLKKVDNEMLHNSQQQLHDGDMMNQKDDGSLSSAFLAGAHTRQTQEYAEKYKLILEKADDYVITSLVIDHKTGNLSLVKSTYKKLLSSFSLLLNNGLSFFINSASNINASIAVSVSSKSILFACFIIPSVFRSPVF